MIYFLISVIVVFAIASLLLAMLSRRHKLHPSTSPIGATGVVDEPVDPQGTIIIEGEVWLALSANAKHYPKGATVEVVGFKQHFLLVDSTNRKTVIGH